MENEFGLIYDNLYNGLFGCAMTWILEVLPYLKNHNVYPNWNINTHCYGVIVPTLIVPKKILSTNNKQIRLSELKNNTGYIYEKKDFKMANELFFEYFDVSNCIYEEVEKYTKQFNGKTLGIHYRGTDKITESEFISVDSVINNITTFLKTHREFKSLFLITDEEKFKQMFLKVGFSSHVVIFSNSKKTINQTPLHFLKDCDINSAKEALVDSITLSKCDYVIKTSSCLSDWSKIWNPELEVYNLNKFKFKWFPQGAIPVKTYL